MVAGQRQALFMWEPRSYLAMASGIVNIITNW